MDQQGKELETLILRLILMEAVVWSEIPHDNKSDNDDNDDDDQTRSRLRFYSKKREAPTTWTDDCIHQWSLSINASVINQNN